MKYIWYLRIKLFREFYPHPFLFISLKGKTSNEICIRHVTVQFAMLHLSMTCLLCIKALCWKFSLFKKKTQRFVFFKFIYPKTKPTWDPRRYLKIELMRSIKIRGGMGRSEGEPLRNSHFNKVCQWISFGTCENWSSESMWKHLYTSEKNGSF